MRITTSKTGLCPEWCETDHAGLLPHDSAFHDGPVHAEETLQVCFWDGTADHHPRGVFADIDTRGTWLNELSLTSETVRMYAAQLLQAADWMDEQEKALLGT